MKVNTGETMTTNSPNPFVGDVQAMIDYASQ